MKAQIFAYTTLLLLIVAVIANSILLHSSIDAIYERIKDAPTEGDVYPLYEEIYRKYMKIERYTSLTVSHSDTSDIEDIFSELLGCAKVQDADGITVAKSRLERALTHLRRLCGINFDSIF